MRRLFGEVYDNTKILVTGHTGFKGSWLVHWLIRLGGNVAGLALDPSTEPNHWDLLHNSIREYRLNICDLQSITEILKKEQPEMIFHLAAQPLVRASYLDPMGTWNSNLMGTLNLLEACRFCESLRAVLVITTDKVYREQERPIGYDEADSLGGHDPYSASKAACEIAVDSYRKSFFAHEKRTFIASARAGNVIGGGDWSQDRLIPDAVRSIEKKNLLEIRSPQATRPWQHVLDCLSGYLLLGEKLLQRGEQYATAWNFGPAQGSGNTVSHILELFASHYPELRWRDVSDRKNLHEAPFLSLNSEKAQKELEWKPVWGLEKSMYYTATWYRSFMERGDVRSDEHLKAYVTDASAARLSWTKKCTFPKRL